MTSQVSDIKLRSICGGWTSNSKAVPKISKEHNNLVVGTFNFDEQSWKDKAARKYMFTSETQKYVLFQHTVHDLNFHYHQGFCPLRAWCPQAILKFDFSLIQPENAPALSCRSALLGNTSDQRCPDLYHLLEIVCSIVTIE